MAAPSKSSKQPVSGLRTIKRDFSSNSLPSLTQDTASSSSDSSAIPWTPTPPQSQTSQPPQIAGMSKRLRAIQDALSGYNIDSDKSASSSSQSQPFGSQVLKRPTAEPLAKRRKLPSGWENFEPAASQVSSTSQNRNVGKTLIVPASSNTPDNMATSQPAGVFLSAEQKHILKLVQAGHNVFYTGSAGTGKSVLLREIIKTLRKRYATASDAVAVTASTGIAACNIGGVTIHSFAGIGLGIEDPETLCRKIRKNKKASARWLRTRVLIIDEVSMVEGDLFDKLSRIGSILRKNIAPFGGIQVIVTGDFFQLPPVVRGGGQVKFAFEADLWSQTIKYTFNLTKVFRQRDPRFVDMLNEMRFGLLTSESIQRFRSLSREIVYEDGLGATELFPRREDVERSNSIRMRGIKTDEHLFKSYDGGSVVDPTQREKMLGNFMAPQMLRLKLGAQVMLIKNIDETLVNGSMGKIVDFKDPGAWNNATTTDLASGGAPASKGKDAKEPKKLAQPSISYPVVEFVQPRGGTRTVLVEPEIWKVELPNGEVQVSRTQLPLILAWAMSIHKSQGQTLERVKVDLAKVFEKGQAYVALSRATSLDGLQVLNFDPLKVKAHPKVVEWSKTLQTIVESS